MVAVGTIENSSFKAMRRRLSLEQHLKENQFGPTELHAPEASENINRSMEHL